MRPPSSGSRRGDVAGSPPFDEEAGTLRAPRWYRQTSRNSNLSTSSTNHQLYDDPTASGSRGQEMSEAAAAAGLPLPAFSHNSSGRINSIASSNMLSISGSDYDSVYQLWRNSGTPSTLGASDRRGSYMSAGSRDPSAAELAAIEQYRNGTLPSHKESGAESGKGLVGLIRGQGGAKGPKDYRAVGLSKYGPGKDKQAPRKRKWLLAFGALLALGLIALAIVVPLSQTVFKNKSSSATSSSSKGDSQGGKGGHGGGSTTSKDQPAVDPKELVATWGTNGSTINLENGNSFMYINNFGGRWVSQPLNDTAQAQSYTPPLDQEFDYVQNRILGVNIGGWLMTEPFISPALYEPYENTGTPAIDEFTLSQRYIAEGGQENLRRKMTEHYETFITERDFAEIAAAGLNWVRIPIGFWALETYDNEPYLERVSWTYFLKAIQWARKYGLRINLDLHAVPGSQNGYNHSGRRQTINFLQGPMGYANGQRTLDYIRQLTEFISQPEVRNVVPMFSIVNEPWVITIGEEAAKAWYTEAYEIVRNVTGYGKGNGPYIAIHDGFIGLGTWNGFLSGADRIVWDTHPYLCFEEQNTDPWDVQIMKPCQRFGPLTDNGRANLGVTVGGETSLAINDCGKFLNGVGEGHRYDGTYSGRDAGNFPRMGSCQVWDDWENYSDEMKVGLRRFALNAMDSLHNFFFWTWKIGNSLSTGKPTSPMWSYKLGLDNGWMPRDPLRQSSGSCQAQAARLNAFTPQTTQWNGQYQAWQTGGANSYSPNTAASPWPPQSMVSANAPVSNLPRYTRTKSIEMVPTPTFSQTAIVKDDPHPTPTIGSWFNTADTRPMFTPIAGCPYPSDQYDLSGWSGSGWPCSGGGNARRDEAGPAGPTPLP